MENVSFQMDLLRLASSIAQQEQCAGAVQPLLVESLSQLAEAQLVGLQSSDPSTVESVTVG